MIKLWHDDIRQPPEGWVWARTNEEAKAILENCWPVIECSLDHDLGMHGVDLPEDPDEFIEITAERYDPEAETGLDLVKWMVEHDRVPARITIHSWNLVGAENMASFLNFYGYSVQMKVAKV